MRCHSRSPAGTIAALRKLSACFPARTHERALSLQRDRQDNDILFAKCEEVSRTGKSTLQKTKIADEMLLAGFCQLLPIVLYDDPNR
jgi:hypothetical protein